MGMSETFNLRDGQRFREIKYFCWMQGKSETKVMDTVMSSGVETTGKNFAYKDKKTGVGGCVPKKNILRYQKMMVCVQVLYQEG